jgi:hypothetical protein
VAIIAIKRFSRMMFTIAMRAVKKMVFRVLSGNVTGMASDSV